MTGVTGRDSREEDQEEDLNGQADDASVFCGIWGSFYGH